MEGYGQMTRARNNTRKIKWWTDKMLRKIVMFNTGYIIKLGGYKEYKKIAIYFLNLNFKFVNSR